MAGVVLSTSHCELEPCLVGGWERGRIAGCLGVGITTGWGETEVFMEVSSRRLAIVQHRHPPARGLLSLISLLSTFLLTGIKRNHAQVGGGGRRSGLCVSISRSSPYAINRSCATCQSRVSVCSVNASVFVTR